MLLEKYDNYGDNNYYEKKLFYSDEDEKKENINDINEFKKYKKNFCNDKCLII